jgi:ribosomal protein S12 methylthiotransferase
MRIHFISLGCPRNLVDSEIMIGRLLAAGHTVVSDEREADCVVVNTCSFIEPAVNESIDVILEMGSWKEERQGRRLIVVGCLPQRYGSDLVKDLPEVDAFLGTGAFHRIVDAAEGIMDDRGRILLPHPHESPLQELAMPRFRTTPAHTAYLKIAEGCSGRCTYCIIPKLRGLQRSRPMEEVLEEAGALVASGVKELVLVAQNTMAYGEDLGPPHHLEGLLEGLTHLSGLVWVRLLYGHPDRMTDSLMETIASHSMICSYFDLPIQHISEPVLKAMGRRHDSTALFRLFDRIRRVVPEAALRTTLMVGFPGESDQDFQCLLDFVERVRFDHLGAFIYSNEKDLPSKALKNHVPDVVKQERFDRLMSRQREISGEVNQKHVGKTLKVLVEGKTEAPDAVWVGRTAFQAPEVDGVVYIESGTAHPGMFADVLITEACEYDIKGTIL